MIDDMGSVGLKHILQDAHSLSLIILTEGIGSQLLVSEESRREGLGMLASDIV